MKNYVYLYQSAQNTPPSSEAMQVWADWMESLGEHLVDGGNPIRGGKVVLRDGDVARDEPDTTIGYSIVKAESLEQAIELAKGSPLANAEGCAIRVYETGQM